MGLPGKWIKALVGLKKSEKSQSSEKDENVGIYVEYFAFLLFSLLVIVHTSPFRVPFLKLVSQFQVLRLLLVFGEQLFESFKSIKSGK